MITTLGLDGDDTLWHSETYFVDVEQRLHEMLARYVPELGVDIRLFATERRNLELFGYGVKAFTLSMIETAIELTNRRVSAADIHQIVEWGKEMLAHPVELLDGVREVVETLSGIYQLVVITKGDLFHQESKVATSGLADLFDGVEIVSEKDERTYARVFERRNIDPAQFLMAGNSVPSDVLPVLSLGGHAAHIPYHVTWVHERRDDADPRRDGYHHLGSIRELPTLAARL